MKKTLLFLLTCAMVATSLFAQPTPRLDEFPTLPGDATIVRSVDQDNSLVFTYDGSIGYFVLYDHTNNLAYQFNTQYNVRVTDMEVYNGSAYFCAMASMGGTLYPMVGQFDIMGVFYGGDVVHYRLLNFWTLGYPVYITKVSRMTVYDDNDTVRILAVGDGVHAYTEPTPYLASTLFSAALNGTTWDLCMDYSKEHRYRFVDIDCTDAFVGVAAIDENDSALLMKWKYENKCFFFGLDKYNLGGKVEEDKIRITGMSGDRFTVAYQPQAEERVVFVQAPEPIISPIQTSSTYPSGSSAFPDWTLLDLRYSEFTDQVLLVGEMALPPDDIFDHWVLGYEWPGGTFRSWAAPVFGRLNSVDEHRGSNLFLATGLYSGSDLMFSSEDIAAPWLNCMKEHPVNDNQVWEDTKEWDTNHDKTECGPLDQTIFPLVEEVEYKIICE